MEKARKNHWETVYETKNPNQVGWTQVTPQTSIDLIESLQVNKNAPIIDIGGGDSKLVDFLLDLGYTNLSVLDISKAAIEKAKKRLGEKENLVKWIVSDIIDFKPTEKYSVWHDRASFHFLLSQEEKETYVNTVNSFVTDNCIIGTFSTDGPKKCSGLDICQYNSETLAKQFNKFTLKDSFTIDHITPFGKAQNFVFATFKK